MAATGLLNGYFAFRTRPDIVELIHELQYIAEPLGSLLLSQRTHERHEPLPALETAAKVHHVRPAVKVVQFFLRSRAARHVFFLEFFSLAFVQPSKYILGDFSEIALGRSHPLLQNDLPHLFIVRTPILFLLVLSFGRLLCTLALVRSVKSFGASETKAEAAGRTNTHSIV